MAEVFQMTGFFMMLILSHKSIVRKDIKLSGQPIVCQPVSFVPDHLIEEAIAVYKSDHNCKITTPRKQMVFIFTG
jgi:hypothetical protein